DRRSSAPPAAHRRAPSRRLHASRISQRSPSPSSGTAPESEAACPHSGDTSAAHRRSRPSPHPGPEAPVQPSSESSLPLPSPSSNHADPYSLPFRSPKLTTYH